MARGFPILFPKILKPYEIVFNSPQEDIFLCLTISEDPKKGFSLLVNQIFAEFDFIFTFTTELL